MAPRGRFYTSGMERKLATVLFVDIVDSTNLTGTDPEVVRRRVNQFFETVSRCVSQHGGIVEKFAGDAVLAAFGVPQAHEDDALRATRAALAMRQRSSTWGFTGRIGIEAGELVVEDAESTFATGEAVNHAARLQQAAMPGEILVGPGVQARRGQPRRRGRRAEGAEGDRRAAPGLAGRRHARRPGRSLGPRAPLVGRESELELLENTFNRSVRDRRAHLFTIYGEPGSGRAASHASSSTASSVRAFSWAARCRTGRRHVLAACGDGQGRWRVSRTTTRSRRRSRSFASAVRRRPSQTSSGWPPASWRRSRVSKLAGDRVGASEVMHGIADVQPLILLFEDIHWAEHRCST